MVWEIGRLPVTVFEAGAEFSIAVTPAEEDRNKIMVLTQGAKVRATDTVTGETIERATAPKTTKLEDDEIGKGDGIVE